MIGQTWAAFWHPYMPHGGCFEWEPGILIPYVLGNALIAVAYFGIPLEISRVDFQRVSLRTMLLFAVFVLACGTGHLIAIVNTWGGLYAPEAYWNLLTGAISLVAWWALRGERKAQEA